MFYNIIVVFAASLSLRFSEWSKIDKMNVVRHSVATTPYSLFSKRKQRLMHCELYLTFYEHTHSTHTHLLTSFPSVLLASWMSIFLIHNCCVFVRFRSVFVVFLPFRKYISVPFDWLIALCSIGPSAIWFDFWYRCSCTLRPPSSREPGRM